ncbi:MAG TPA: A/G-specific adenine glycosylase [Pirellulales bacterium]|nr:A/G-specific adenine glycosylase [Pirellulales bacterium]
MKSETPSCSVGTDTGRRRFRRRLLAWYRRNARDLPWRRRSDDPYAVWVSEIMLQQTQVSTVIAYFNRFMAAMPDVAALAKATEQDVLRLWEGLGYYRRARQMHRAARVIIDEHGGIFPSDATAVRALPGIGRYTAGAILSIAFDKREPIVEANTARLLARLLAFRGDVSSTTGQRRLWTLAEQLLPARGAGEMNQALMELGSQVCTPREPCCNVCPAMSLCPTRARGLQDRIPAAKKKLGAEAVHETAVVVRRDRQVLMMRRHGHGRWGGLWNFPRFTEGTIVAEMKRLAGLRVRPAEHLATLKHTVTRFRITLECHAAEYVSGTLREHDDMELRWFDIDALTQLPLPVTARKLAASLATRVEPPLPLRERGRGEGS